MAMMRLERRPYIRAVGAGTDFEGSEAAAREVGDTPRRKPSVTTPALRRILEGGIERV